jgi:hypothetical protein
MDLVKNGGSPPVVLALRSWVVPPRRIGGTTYQGECRIVRVRHASYHQQSTTFGRTSGVFGLASDGHGFVTGGGGFVDTTHRGVVSVVVEDEHGYHEAQELPSSTSALEGGVIRLDFINANLIAVTNLSGRQPPTLLLGPSAFIARTTLTRTHGALLLAALVSAGQLGSAHPLEAAALTAAFGVAPAMRLRRLQSEARARRLLEQYMVEVLS